MRSPDVCFVSAAKLKRSPSYFATVIPDLAVEVKSQSDCLRHAKRDRIKPLEEKIKYFLSLGVEVGMLIDPDKLTVSMYRSGTKKVVIKGDELITVPELLLGWSIMVSELWPPVFEDED